MWLLVHVISMTSFSYNICFIPKLLLDSHFAIQRNLAHIIKYQQQWLMVDHIYKYCGIYKY